MCGKLAHRVAEPGEPAKENDGSGCKGDAGPAALRKDAAADGDAPAGAEEGLVFVVGVVELGGPFVAKGDVAEIGPVGCGPPGGRTVKGVFAGEFVLEFGGERSMGIACL